MTRIDFNTLDTLFFRDGSPFNARELQAGVQTSFPPSPQTLVGAVRACAARELNWDGRSRNSNWDKCCREKLGSGPDLGPLSFAGPFVLLENDRFSDEPLFPIPADTLGKVDQQVAPSIETRGRPQELARLIPSDTPRDCDLGKVRLPELPEADSVQGRKLLHPQWWLTSKGMQTVLNGGIPNPASDLIHQSELWAIEPRVGISRDIATRTTKQQALYAPRHIRLQRGVKLSFYVSGIDSALGAAISQDKLQAVGGESRSCWLDVAETEIPIPPVAGLKPDDDGSLRYTVIVLSPLNAAAPPISNSSFCGLPGTVVSACLPRPQFWGGWDGVSNRPLPLEPHLAPGSVIFMETAANDLSAVASFHGQNIGLKCEWGYGLILIGVWKARRSSS